LRLKKLKERFQSALIFRLYNLKFSIRFETDISGFAIKIIISQLFSTEDDKRKKKIFDYVLIAKVNERGEELRRLRYRILSYNRSVQRMATLFRRNSIYG
jgi:hypothetical protein